MIYTQIYSSPCGKLLLGSFEDKLCLCYWLDNSQGIVSSLERSLQAKMVMGSNEVLEQAMLELNEFFSGVRTEFNIPLLLHGTNFQISVWSALLDIPLGKVATYADLAHRIGNPKAVRAIGLANKVNKIQIFLPCHRIIGSNQLLTGYAGGLEAKSWLLEWERQLVDKMPYDYL